MNSFSPPLGLGSGHVQTIIGSSLRKVLVKEPKNGVQSIQKPTTFTAFDGTRLVAWVSEHEKPSSTVIVIHGWLGTHTSGYNLSLSEHLWANGFNVVRLNLRDHGGTAHLNEGMFHNGLIEEVVDVVGQMQQRFGSVGIAGFSLGGNFALRIAKALKIPSIGICPLMDPAASIIAVDSGWSVYRSYFRRKWLNALIEKSSAFPDRYQFESTGAYGLKSVHDMTEHFITHYTDYPSLQDYYDCYTLTGSFMDGVEAAILAAADDPVVPATGFSNLPSSLEVEVVPQGGHCAFIDSYRMSSYIDGYVGDYFRRTLVG